MGTQTTNTTVGLIALALSIVVGTVPLQAQTTTRVSVASDGSQASVAGYSRAAVSADGRFIAFPSFAPTLVPDDTNLSEDVFVHDRQTGSTTRVSVATGGAQGNGASSYPSISADGRFVAFDSLASNLVPGDTNGAGDVFVHDRVTGTISRVSVAADGAQGNGPSSGAAISAAGRYVAFSSGASNLVPGDTNTTFDVFVRDTTTDVTARQCRHRRLPGHGIEWVGIDQRGRTLRAVRLLCHQPRALHGTSAHE